MSDLIPGLSWVTQAAVVVLAFSVLIFVHELGHYLAAVFTGVRVERFFIGFDIFGLALKKEYKGTVYGIGILPLGGYCALAGQNDDPRKEKQTDAPDELQNKPLWARALVFSGGVLMNFLFGFLVLIAAYMYGIPFIPATVGKVDPNGPAAVYGMKSGDRILSVDGKSITSFDEASEAIALAGSGGVVDVAVSRDAGSGSQPEILNFSVKGRASSMRGNLNTIGVEPARSRFVAGLVDDPDFLERISGKLAIGDEILAVNGVDLPPNMGHLLPEMLENQPGETVDLTVKSALDQQVRDVRVPLETYGEWDMGMRIAVQIGNVMEDGPADKAGFRKGDLVVAYQRSADREPRRFTQVQDFLDLVAESALRCVDIDFARGDATLSAVVKPRVMLDHPEVNADTDTLLGVFGQMDGDAGFRIDAVLADSPADGVLSPGDRLVGINGKPLAKGLSLREMVEGQSSDKVKFFINRPPAEGEDPAPTFRGVPDANLALELSPRIMPEYQRPMIGIDLLAGPVTAVEPDSFADRELGGIDNLRGKRLGVIHYSPDLATTTIGMVLPASGDKKSGNLQLLTADTPAAIRSDPLASGLRSRLPLSLRVAEEVNPLPFFPAVAAAGRKWVDLSMMVYRVIHKLVVRTLPLDAVGGPVQLFRIIKFADDKGFAYLLYIIALISVNLGVCNLLPFPVLDGGHLLFLLLEWIMGRPPPQAVRDTAQYIGLACLLTLMLTVTGYDLFHLFSGTG